MSTFFTHTLFPEEFISIMGLNIESRALNSSLGYYDFIVFVTNENPLSGRASYCLYLKFGSKNINEDLDKMPDYYTCTSMSSSS